MSCAAKLAAIFKTYDKNSDGYLALEEYNAWCKDTKRGIRMINSEMRFSMFCKRIGSDPSRGERFPPIPSHPRPLGPSFVSLVEWLLSHHTAVLENANLQRQKANSSAGLSLEGLVKLYSSAEQLGQKASPLLLGNFLLLISAFLVCVRVLLPPVFETSCCTTCS